MDEAARFLRYVIPGLVSLMAVVFFLLISDPAALCNCINSLAEAGKALAAILLIFLGSGVLGYVHAQIYFALSAICPHFVLDHSALFVSPNHIFKAVRAGSPQNVLKVSRRQAWSIITRYCFSQIELHSGKDIKGLNSFVERLVHIMHSLGSAAIGVFFAMFYWLVLLWALYNNRSSCCAGGSGDAHSPDWALWQILAILVVWVILQIVFWGVRYDTKRKIEALVNSHIRERLKGSIDPIELIYED